MLENLGTGLSLAGSVASLFGGGGGMKPAEALDAQRLAQINLWENQLPALALGAKNAGFHPLVAAGVNPASGPSIGGIGEPMSTADRLSEAGQNISRAAGAMGTKAERATLQTRDALMLEKMGLENELLRTQISTINRPTSPPIGGDATGSNQGAEYGPVGLNSPTGPHGSKEGGATTDFTYSRTSGGGLTIVPSADVKQRIEDTLLPELQWSYRNTHLLKTPPRPDSKQFPLPKGHIWKWNPTTQEWRPYKKGILHNMNPFN